jgi:WD40 repeat protein
VLLIDEKLTFQAEKQQIKIALPELINGKTPNKLILQSWKEAGIDEPIDLIFPDNELETAAPPKEEEDNEKNDKLRRQPVGSDITSLDISPQGGLYAIGTAKGEILVGSTRTSKILRKLTPNHLLDTLQTRFFPASNGEALISSSDDMHLRVWSTANGGNPRSFSITGKPLTDPPSKLAFVGETGRNFFSNSGADLYLWETGEEKLVHIFKGVDPIVDFVVLMVDEYEIHDDAAENVHEFGTNGAAVISLAAGANKITIWNVFTKEQTYVGNLPGVQDGISIVSLLHFSHGVVIGATSAGHLIVWNLKFSGSNDADPEISVLVPLTQVSIFPIVGLATLESSLSVLICTKSSPVLVELLEPQNQLKVKAVFLGFDAKTASTITSYGKKAYIAGKSGSLYEYNL